MTGMFSVTWVLALGILFIAAGIGLLVNHDYWYLFPIPMGIGGFILYFDFSMKRAIIKYYEEQLKPIHELEKKIIDEINSYDSEQPKVEGGSIMTRCSFFYHSPANTFPLDTQCIFDEGHKGEHRYREIFPPPQPARIVYGWVDHKIQNTKEDFHE